MQNGQTLKFSNAYALVIGVGEYKDFFFSDLPETENDAKAIGKILCDPALCGYDAANVHLFVNEQAARTNIVSSLKRLAKSTNYDSTVFIYFSGHGGQACKDGARHTYLCLRETDPFNLPHTAVSGEEFSTLVASIPAQKVLVIIDACHAEGIAEPRNADADIKWKPGFPEYYYESLNRGRGRVVIASSTEYQQSYSRPQRDFGIFTWHLCQALKGKAAVRGDGLVHVLDVFHYVNEGVRTDKPKKQTPLLKVKNLDLNFPIALHREGKHVSPKSSNTHIADIREQIIREPIKGAKALTEYLKEKKEWVAERNDVDLKRSELERIQKEIDLYGPDPAVKTEKNRNIYYLLRICLKIENN
jgi:uncharacterized caspase-like protein